MAKRQRTASIVVPGECGILGIGRDTAIRDGTCASASRSQRGACGERVSNASPNEQTACKQQEQDRHVRSGLRDAGYQVVTVRYDRDLEQQVKQFKDAFGEGTLERSQE